MVEFLQFTLSGVVFGMIYAAVALSLVLIWRGTRLLNYAQGGMAMFTTYVAIEVIYHTGSYWAGFVVALAAGIVLGAACQLTVIRPTIEQAAAQRGDRDHRAAHLARGPGRHLLRRAVPVVPRGVLDHRAEGRARRRSACRASTCSSRRRCW